MKKIIVSCLILLAVISYQLPIAYAASATLSVSPASGTLNRGCSYPIQILLDTGGAQTDGTDAILIYDTSRLSATSINQGSIYNNYPGNNIDDTAGRVNLSGLASVTQAFSGKGTLATVNFTVKSNAPAGATEIKFAFDSANKADTTDSNVVERGTIADILNSVVNGSYVVGTGACTGDATGVGSGTVVQTGLGQGATGISTPSGDFSKKNLDEVVGGKTGSEELTYTIVIIGTTLTILGMLGLAIL